MSIYIKAIEIGLENEVEGISYHELKRRLENELSITMSPKREMAFMTWFVNNFDTVTSRHLRSPSFLDTICKYVLSDEKEGHTYEKGYDIQLKNTFYVGSTAIKQYNDHKELKLARKSAISAKYWAVVATILAIGSLVVTTKSTISKDAKLVEVVNAVDNSKLELELGEVKELLQSSIKEQIELNARLVKNDSILMITGK